MNRTHRLFYRLPGAAALVLIVAALAGPPPNNTDLDLHYGGFFARQQPIEEAEAPPEEPPPPPVDAPALPPEVQALVDEVAGTSETIAEQPGGERKIVFEGDPSEPAWLSALTVTRSTNPLLEAACRKQAMNTTMERLAATHDFGSDDEARRFAMDHLREHQEFVRNNEVSFTAYMQSIANCREFCAPLIASLMQCHIGAVARMPHGIVLFAFNSAAIPGADRGTTDLLDNTADVLARDPNLKAMLIGRASKIGNLEYNRRLAGMRALAVRDELLQRGVDEIQLHTIWFGWEPPQISSQVAREYGFNEMFNELGEQTMNQSVIIAIYPEKGELNDRLAAAAGR